MNNEGRRTEKQLASDRQEKKREQIRYPKSKHIKANYNITLNILLESSMNFMLLEMSLQISFLTGSVRTSRKRASKGFFTTMDTLMDDETDLLCEGVGATRIGTFEGAVSSMCSHMDYDIRLSCGAVVTAFKWTVIFGDLIGLLLHWTLHRHQDGR